ncbi:hypothetical protein H0H81_011632 [Sphagnurus paluster]|uniref:Uncharacterized protein n=1 Tax=Sphagnurus paluster TaxID=117069 RepID=A0A9P7GIE6_9AGAR|nr:hypothetical protein H0H81_011632 [Sphagnurus paluster]
MIGFFRTTSDTNLPTGYDATLEIIRLGVCCGCSWANGHEYGKRNQIASPIPPGVVDMRGSNVIHFNPWLQIAAGFKVDLKWDVFVFTRGLGVRPWLLSEPPANLRGS